jgi:hypothetical protein
MWSRDWVGVNVSVQFDEPRLLRLWTRGAFGTNPAFSATARPRILVFATEMGHLDVLQLLVETAGIPFGGINTPNSMNSCVGAACAVAMTRCRVS